MLIARHYPIQVVRSSCNAHQIFRWNACPDLFHPGLFDPCAIYFTTTEPEARNTPKQNVADKATPTKTAVKTAATQAAPQGSFDRQAQTNSHRGIGAGKDGFIKIAGDVKNTSSNWARSVRIEVTLLDASGKTISEEPRVYASIERVAPGASTPFEFIQDVNHVTGTYASHKLDVSAIIAEQGATPKLENVTSP